MHTSPSSKVLIGFAPGGGKSSNNTQVEVASTLKSSLKLLLPSFFEVVFVMLFSLNSSLASLLKFFLKSSLESMLLSESAYVFSLLELQSLSSFLYARSFVTCLLK